MAVAIRLKRIGAKNKPAFRVVVTDSKNPRDGRFIEQIGSYNPRTEPPAISINKERAEYWLKVGATPSPTVKSLFKKSGLK